MGGWAYSSAAPSAHHLCRFQPVSPICRISIRDARAPRCTTGNGKTGQGAYRVVYNVGQNYGMYSQEMKRDAFPDEP